jgi:release factor glutamine methyltransferase
MAIFNVGDSVATCQKISPLDGLETRMLLSHIIGLNRVQLITQSEYQLTEKQAQLFSALVDRRLSGEPIAYLLGVREFYGLPFKVSPDVLIPRPETELLVELALSRTPENGALLDLGTGSGAIAVTIASLRPDLNITASDISTSALKIAKYNAQQLLPENAEIRFVQSDWYQQITLQQFTTIVSNPPYIVKDDAHLFEGDLRFEPINALTDHADGLSAYRQIILGATSRLTPNGWLLMEHGYDQAKDVQTLLTEHGFREVQSWADLAGILRVTGGVKA